MKGEKDTVKITNTLKTEHEILYNPSHSCLALV